MSEGKKKINPRRCALCQRIGHNRSTCPERSVGVSKNTVPNPLKFFVHHTIAPTAESAHRINLKNSIASPWNLAASAAPIAPSNPDYFWHQSTPKKPKPETPFADDPEETLDLPPRDTTPVQIIFNSQTKGEKILDFFQALKQFVQNARAKTLKIFQTAPKIKTPRKKIGEFFSLPVLRRTMFASVALAAILLAVAPLESYVNGLKNFQTTLKSESTAGFMALKDTLRSLTQADWGQAREANTLASGHFSVALKELNDNHRVLQTIAAGLPIVHTIISDRERLLLAGQAIALGNEHILAKLTALPENAATPERLLAIATGGNEAIGLYSDALANLVAVQPESVPVEFRDQFKKYQTTLGEAKNQLTEVVALSKMIPDLLGGSGRRRYLVMFQNPAELRATGGFMGSFAFIEMYNGQLVTLNVPAGGTYDTQGQLNETITPPAPLLLANRRFEFQDANWYPDWLTSAQKIAWFYRHSRGQSVDGVMAVNASVLPKLLGILGPINDAARGTTWESDSVIADLQTAVERGPDKTNNRPKAVIGELANTLTAQLAALKNPDDLLKILFVLRDALRSKEIQMAWFDPALENEASALGWTGTILPTQETQDYLLVAASNIQGQKSDARVSETIRHEAVVDESGHVVVTVTITRHHNGEADELDYGAANISFVRVYAPLGSHLISASGFSWPDEKAFRAPLPWSQTDPDLLTLEKPTGVDDNSGTAIAESFGKTMFGNWMITEPGTTSTAILTYRLPFQVFPYSTSRLANTVTENAATRFLRSPPPISYQLVAQSQSGIAPEFTTRILFPANFSTLWVAGPGASAGRNGLTTAPEPLNNDRVYSLLVSPQ